MSILDKAAGAVTAKALGWAILAVVLLLVLLGLSIAGNVRQWADHRAYVTSEAARLESAALKSGLQVAARIAKQKGEDAPKLLNAISRIDARVAKLAGQAPPPALPIQCAPGKQRMDAVNAGADR